MYAFGTASEPCHYLPIMGRTRVIDGVRKEGGNGMEMERGATRNSGKI